MKPLNKLSNIERAKLLFELFPDEIPAFIAFTKDFTYSLIHNPGKLKNKAFDKIHTTELWQELVTYAKERLDKYGNKLAKRSRLFSDQLFDGYNSIYASCCLHQYIINTEMNNRKFKHAVMLLFF